LPEQGLSDERAVTLKRDRIKVAAGSEAEVDVFSEREVSQLLFFAEDRSRCSLRNQLILFLLLYTGVRVSELCCIRLTDVDYLTSSIRVTGKGGKYREIPLRPNVAETIRQYVRSDRQASKHRESEFLLVSQRAKRLHRDAVGTMLEGIGLTLGIKAYPHKFRHTFCTMLLQKGVPLTTVSKLAGHQYVQTTSTYYISTSRQDKMQAVNLL